MYNPTSTYPARVRRRVCFYCHGAGLIADDYEFEELCPICGGSGRLECVER